MNADAKGYYAILGIQSSATLALIRAAYRVRAMELHPDRNKDTSATRDFQKLQEAYNCLSDESRRAAYDRVSEAEAGRAGESASRDERSSSKQSESHPRDSRQVPRKPVVCTSCGAITARPRFREFLTVTSFLVTSRKSTERGIYCIKCERKKAAFATGLTLVMGWWGLHGFFWTFEALAKNLEGSWRYAKEDARLLCIQALYFASIGKLALAHAVAVESHAMALGVRKLTAEEARKQKLGYEVKDSMQDIREVMADLIEQTKAAGASLQLVRPHRLRQQSFLIQAGLLSAALIAVGVLVWTQAARQRELEAQRAQAEQARLIREGIARERARAIAQKRADELRTIELPLPSSGLMRRFVANSLFNSPGGLPVLKVVAPAEASYLIKLARWDSNVPVLTMFVRAGESAEVTVPFGDYRIRMASGTTWYGEKIRFGPDTRYSQVDAVASFGLEGDRLLGHELLLRKIKDGNLRPSPIGADQF